MHNLITCPRGSLTLARRYVGISSDDDKRCTIGPKCETTLRNSHSDSETILPKHIAYYVCVGDLLCVIVADICERGTLSAFLRVVTEIILIRISMRSH